MTDVILAALVFGPLAIAYLLKSNGALAFLTLCTSFVLITFASADIQQLTGRLDFSIDSSVLNLFLLIFPLVLTLLLTRRSVKGQFKMILHGLAVLATGGLLALVGIPMLADALSLDFKNSWGWDSLQQIQAWIVGVGVFITLVLIWSGGLTRAKKHK